MAINIVSLSGVAKSYDGRPILESVSLGIDAGEKVGIIGANGAGKSTLLGIIAGRESADDGKVAIRGGTRVTTVEQVSTLEGARTVREAIEEPLADLRRCIHDYEIAAAEARDDAQDLLERIEQLGGWDYQHRIETAASQLGLDRLDARVETLSGGERKRVALARMVIEDPDLVLLDEPTNHLDAASVEWLEGWLSTTRATCLVVTHDRYFLDQVVDRLVEVREGAARSYAGNYTDYLAARAIEEAQRERTQHRQLRILMGELEWARRSPMARTTKSRARLERIEAVQEEVGKRTGKNYVADFRFGQPPRLGGTILEIEDVHLGYADAPELLSGLTLKMRRGERIGILGSNGSGKTTLLSAICGTHAPRAGKIILGQNTRIAYFDQHRAALDPQATVRQTVAPDGGEVVFPGGGSSLHVASWLDRFGFAASEHSRPVATLSGGERNRLAIARFLLQEANLLILDEPTNDLDIQTLNMLEEAIASFEGCVLIVSHDRYLLDKVATGILAFEGEYLEAGAVSFVQGSYTHYHDNRLAGLRADHEAQTRRRDAAERAARSAGRGEKKRPAKKGLTYAERLELEGLEPRIQAAELESMDLETRLADPELWAGGTEEAQKVGERLEKARARAAELFARWEYLVTREEESAG